ncbi:hypothetical protein GBO17_02595 [Mycobacterium avium subsp. hominissuis]|uniref:hypothetical protein n=1 Tax=Mycobacterium avium TaxID=1764 RepID=UPI001CC51CD0|nr:hypothetical protein [Mycobacterium avium]MBZ4557645.1 hypothetical protein [Mycobacterium avium subsp. hominissuis]MBZ4567385.1 hypothetical protein [Mycobacterium avium subsp. hominissuis]MBZ4586221.1 hypothetical protein [Mycobacterium avium subsp. hominissuis]MBZ4624542.1 hypothetical protein [Mycobacterium avium subsp. hominissuis]
MDDFDPEYEDRLRRKYINPPNTLEQAAINAEAEQHAHTMIDLHRACERYNGAKLAWITWEIPEQLRKRIDISRARLREAQARDSREAPPGPRASIDSPGTVWYDDDTNKYHEANGWPAYDPDNPHHQTVAFGLIVAEPDTVHVLRGGTFERVTEPEPRHFQRPSEERKQVGLDDESLPELGGGYDFDEFMRRAENFHSFRFCDLQLEGDCTGGGDKRLVAVPRGQYVYAVSVCSGCMEALWRSWRQAHPEAPPPDAPAGP